MYKLPCAFACNGAISNNALSCSSMMEMEGMDDMPATTPECRANDTSFLTTLAWCFKSKCAEFNVPVSKLQKFWEEEATGEPTAPPKWSYPAALQSIQEAPTKILTMHDSLNLTALTSEEDWDMQFKILSYFEREEVIHARYGDYHPPLALYVNNGTDSEELNLPYWIWGCVATVAVVIMLVASNFYRKFGYEVWLYAACTVWFFDRMMHMLPVLKNGMRRFNIVNIDDDVVRVDIHGIRWAAGPGQHVYVYFPTLNRLRSWENHPFSFDAIHTEVNWADESLDDK
ncbi:hypothetical protein BN1708_000211 [Verticillium longisporum]|uniref:FAD-binding 8 domain-containing protein n=1 Tax=Verticillium longisporum TaxID=100787 RepID=A0A0G4KCG0_VERLO|nr:hypothetical protein BN1708_000211 [Verticillium longisporum]